MTSTSLSILPKPCWPLSVSGILQGSQPINPIEPQFVSNVLYVTAVRRLCLLLHLVDVLLLQIGGDCPGMITHGVIVSITNVDGSRHKTFAIVLSESYFYKISPKMANFIEITTPLIIRSFVKSARGIFYHTDTLWTRSIQMWGVTIFLWKCR